MPEENNDAWEDDADDEDAAAWECETRGHVWRYPDPYAAPRMNAALDCRHCGTVCTYHDEDDIACGEDFTEYRAARELIRGYAAACIWSGLVAMPDDRDDYRSPDGMGDAWSPTLAHDVECEGAAAWHKLVASPAAFDAATALVGSGLATWEQHGHDALLTRDRHGAGYWDRGYGDPGDVLTRWAHGIGEAGYFFDDAGQVCFATVDR